MPVTLPTLTTFLFTCLLIELTPGPNMGYLALVSLNHGRKAGVSVLIGIAVGLMTIGIIAAVGVSTAAKFPLLYQTLRWIGAGYLLWLAWESWTTPTHGTAQEPIPTQKFLFRGFLTNILNPKAALFYLTILPDFIDPQRAVIQQTYLLTTLYVAVATFVHALIVAMAGYFHRTVSLQDPATVRKAFSLALLAIALWFIYKTQH